ncbi:hypothetical protein IAR55_003627 [Kwoniella newhampshirensis]|uniref:Uncharacterized protein n=1 Tax=Kwoniella newhampshirensis TaxID=1651941 RepID=A0AAW0YZ50_9TREE
MGEHLALSRWETTRSHTESRLTTKTKTKRIVMNPPQSFVDFAATFAAAAASSAQPPTNGPLMIGSNGQAVMLSPSSPQSSPPSDTPSTDSREAPPAHTEPGQNVVVNGNGGEVVLSGSVIQVSPTPTSMNSLTPTSLSADAITSIGSATTVTVDDSAVTITSVNVGPTSSITTASTSESGTTIQIGSSATPTSTSLIDATSSIQSVAPIPITTSAPATAPATTSSSQRTSSSLTLSGSSTSFAATATSISANNNAVHQPPSAPLIFLAIVLSLVLFGALVTLFRYLFRSSSSSLRQFPFCCCLGRRRRGHGDDDDDDGLSDFVAGLRHDSSHDHHDVYGGDTGEKYGYGSYDYSSSAVGGAGEGYGIGPTYEEVNMNSNHNHENPGLGLGLGTGDMVMDMDLQRRSNNFAIDKHQSPFLHSGITATTTLSPPSQAYGGRQLSSGHQLYGETGRTLEVRNALPGEVEWDSHTGPRGEAERETVNGVDGLKDIGLDGGSPRFLGVDGNGLPVPWTLPPRPDEMESRCPTPTPYHLTVNQLGPGPTNNFPSPLPSPSSALNLDSDPFPQRSATWASNLRSTLYAAISAARVPTTASLAGAGAGAGGMEDRFTRTVGVVSRMSMKRGKLPIFDEESAVSGMESGFGSFPIVVEEKDEKTSGVPPAGNPSKVAGGANEGIGAVFLSRIESDDSNSTLTPPRKFGGGASERYKRYYARSKSTSSATASEAGDSEAETVGERRPSALMGGERAKGARTGSFIVA